MYTPFKDLANLFFAAVGAVNNALQVSQWFRQRGGVNVKRAVVTWGGWVLLLLVVAAVLITRHKDAQSHSENTASQKSEPTATTPRKIDSAVVSPGPEKPTIPSLAVRQHSAINIPSKADKSPVLVSPPPAYEQKCETGSQCNSPTSGGTVLYPTVINNKDPPPTVQDLTISPLAPIPAFEPMPSGPARDMKISAWKQSLGFELESAQMTENPGLVLTFHMSSSFIDPDFNVACDKPCGVTSYSVQESNGSNFSASNQRPGVLSSRTMMVITVRSLDPTNPATTAKVKPKTAH